MEKYAKLLLAGFLSADVIEPVDMTTRMLSDQLDKLAWPNVNEDLFSIALQAFRLIRQGELLDELSNRASGAMSSGHYDEVTSGWGVSPDVFDPGELHYTEWQKSVDRFTKEGDLILQVGIKASARLVFIEIRIAQFKAAIRRLAKDS